MMMIIIFVAFKGIGFSSQPPQRQQRQRVQIESLCICPKAPGAEGKPRVSGNTPPSCCQNEPTPFMESDERAVKHLTQTLG